MLETPKVETPKVDIHPVAGGKRWVDNIAAISSAVIAIGTLLSWFLNRQGSFPKWFFYVLTVFILFIMYKYFENSIRSFVQSFSVRSYLRQQHHLLIDHIQRFAELVTLRGEDSITQVLDKIGERSKQEIVDRDLFAFPDQLLSNILLRLSESGRGISVGEFKGVLNDLNSLIKFCSHFYFKKPLHIRGITGLNAEERKSVDLARENFADFVRRYQTFFDEVNGRLGSSARAHFEIPKPLA
jgi:hypothetical protein